MNRNRKAGIIVTGITALIALALALAVVSWNSTAKASVAVPHGTYTSSTTAPPTGTPTTTPPPVVNPFAGCHFAVTQAFTYSTVLHRLILRDIPAIICVRGPWWHRVVTVYDQIGGDGI